MSESFARQGSASPAMMRGGGRQFWAAMVICAAMLMLGAGISRAADCVDGDGDGYVVCSGCDLPSGKQCGDCDDFSPAVHPGAVEICGDGIDNNCDGVSMEPGGGCIATGPGICPTASILECSSDQLSLVCSEPESGYREPSTEGWSEPATCSDAVDNDCDGPVDAADAGCAVMAEVCDGYDNDFNGLVDETISLVDDAGVSRAVGEPCLAGQGVCAHTGSVICAGDGTAICSEIAGVPEAEELGTAACADGLDNDCDGLTDAADPSCAPTPTGEVCDGVGNDLDGLSDEGFGVGVPCTVGIGACENNGLTECTADGLAALCSAFPLPASLEGPDGPTCFDGIDNDCDGLTDAADPSCQAAAAGLRVQCGLPYMQGRTGGDCNGNHKVEFTVAGGNPETTVVQAELLGLAADGELLGVLTGIEAGDEAHLASRLDARDFRMNSKTNKRGTRHTVFAPVPLLRVTARDGDAEAQAYCSNIPYLEVIKPDGAVVSVGSGDRTEVTAALPLVNSQTLTLKVDGVDILAGLGIDPATDFPGGPFAGTVLINGQPVEVEDLLVEVSGSTAEPAANTLTMALENLGGGGHIIYLEAEPVVTRTPLTEQCLQDDIADAGTVAGLEVTISSPVVQEVFFAIPAEGVPVAGQVRHGREIAGLKLNGMPVDVSGQIFQPGDGVNYADQYLLDFSQPLPEVDLRLAVNGQAPVGTIQRGSNRLVADVVDELGNRAFATRIFAAGDVMSPAQTATIVSLVESKVSLAYAASQQFFLQSTAPEIQNAFVAGLEESAVDRVFKRACTQAVTEFKTRMEATLRGLELGNISIKPDCSCNVTEPLVLRSITFGSHVDCDAAFSDDQIDVTFELPDVSVVIGAKDSCVTHGLFGECVAETILDVEATTHLYDPVFSFTVTEEQIETNTPPDDSMKTFVIGSMRSPGSNGESLENDSEVWRNDSDINCYGASVCSFFEGVAGFLVNVFTLGFVEATDVFDFISVDFQMADFEQAAGSSEPDPTGIGAMAIDNQEVEEFGQAAFTPALADVEITPAGLTAAFKATFETQTVDPGGEEVPGAALTPAPAPGPAQGTIAQNGFMVLADDAINQLFASMAASGGLQATCRDTGKTVDDLLPADCESLTAEKAIGTATIQGICWGLRGADCENLPEAGALEQGVCHGVQGDDCTTIVIEAGLAGTVEQGACNNTPDLHLTAADPLLFCAKQSIPPQMLLNGDNSTAPQLFLDTTVLLNDLTVSMLVDRGASGLDGELAAVPNCFAADSSSLADCSLFAACLDISIAAGMSLDNSQCEPNETGFIFSVDSVTTSGIEAGVVCGGATQTDDSQVTGQAAQDSTVAEITDSVEIFTPPLCAKGLNLGGLLDFSNPRLISIDTGGADDFGDYFGIIGEINP